MGDVGYICANFSLPGLSVLELGPMYATDVRQTDVRSQTKALLNASAHQGRGHKYVAGLDLGLGLEDLASASVWCFWPQPRPWPRRFGLV